MAGMFFILIFAPTLFLIGIYFLLTKSNSKRGGVFVLCSLVSVIIGFSLCSKQSINLYPPDSYSVHPDADSTELKDTIQTNSNK